MTSVPSLSHPLHPEVPDGAPLPAPRREREERLGVPAWAPFAAALAALVGMTVVQLLVVAAIGAAGGDVQALNDDNDFSIVMTAVFDLLLVGCSIAVVWRLAGQASPAMFALRRAPVVRSLA